MVCLPSSITDNNEINYQNTHTKSSVESVRSKVHETYKVHLNLYDHHLKKAISAGYNNNY